MPEILRFRSTWGVPPGPNFEKWKSWFPDVKNQGYSGLEINLLGIHEDLTVLTELCEGLGLRIIVQGFSEWPGYVGPRPAGLGPSQHLAFYKQMLQQAKQVKPLKVNVQSGADYWTLDESVEFYKGTLSVDAELGLEGKVCHETHRNRSLFTPYATAYILKHVPNLRVTADVSHHVVCCERFLDEGEEDKQLLEVLIPNVHHIHARIGLTQGSQCPDPTNEIFAAERAFFEGFWKKAIQYAARNRPETPLTFVPEYGPYPYHPFGSARDYSEVCDTEGARLHKLFEEYADAAT